MIGITTMFAKGWIPRPGRRAPTLGKLLAAHNNPALTSYLTTTQRWPGVDHLLVADSLLFDNTEVGKQSARIHFYVALGTFGLSVLGAVSTPVLSLLTLPVQVYFVARFLQGGITQVVRTRRVGMAVIDGLVTSALLGLGYLWAIPLYASFFIWSRRMLLHSSARYQDSLLHLASTPPQRVRILCDAHEAWIDLDALSVHDVIVVYAGEVMPVDGVVLDGLASIDQQFLTGEAQPVEREAGQHVLAMTLVLSGHLHIRAEQTGTSTVSAQISSLLRGIQRYTATLNTQAEAIGNRYALPMLALSGTTWLLLGPLSALTVLCAYLGYSLRITGPLSVLNYLQRATRHNILVKDGRAFEALHMVDTVIFDKTGTLTQDQPQVVGIYAYAGYSEDDVLALAAAAEQHQTHPIARALLQAADDHHLDSLPAGEARYEPGVGVQIQINGKLIHVVSERFLQREDIALPPYAETVQAYCYQRGHSLVYVVSDDTVIGTIELAPTLRPAARQVVSRLQQRGKRVWIVSGDHEQPTRWLAHALQTDAYYANMLPPEKARLIADVQAEGHLVCFVGDGLNDALALKQANVAVSLHGAAGLALDTAQIIIPEEDLHQLLTLFDLSRQLRSRMRGNLLCSIVPGIITIGGVYLFHWGVVAAYILYYTGLTLGISNAMAPLVLADKATMSLAAPSAPAYTRPQTNVSPVTGNA
jgi:Cu2+-exporting ATPase